jgi:hypothetical protein
MLIFGVVFVSVAAKSAWNYYRLFQARVPDHERQRVRSAFVWRWPTTVTYVLALGGVDRLLTGAGLNPHTHPSPFVLFGLSLGLSLTLWEMWNAKQQRGK